MPETIPASSGAVRRLVLVGAQVPPEVPQCMVGASCWCRNPLALHNPLDSVAAVSQFDMTEADCEDGDLHSSPSVSPRHRLLGDSDTESLADGVSTVSSHNVVEEESLADVVHDIRGNSVAINSVAIREAFLSFDAVDLHTIFAKRAAVMKAIPRFLRGSFRNAMRVAMDEALQTNEVRRTRGWKLFLLLPKMLLHRSGRGGNISRSKLVQRFDDFCAGQWTQLLSASASCDSDAMVAKHRKRRRQMPEDDVKRRAARALSLVQMGELSAGRQALEGAAPGNNATLQMLQDPWKRPPRTRLGDEIPRAIMELGNLRTSHRGAAAGPSGMNADHLRPVLDSHVHSDLLFKLGEQLSRAETPPVIVDVIRLGRITTVQKPSGGVRGIVVGDILQRLVSRTIGQQMSDVVEAAAAPYQYALSTRAGTETEDNPRTTVLSIDGIGAFDLISQKSMLEALITVEGGPDIMPFVRQFYGQPSKYLWESDDGIAHQIEQGEGGEQGDPLMPLLFALGQHASLCAIDEGLAEGERLMAFLDDVYISTNPEGLQQAYGGAERVLWRHARIRVREGKSQVWNSGGVRPEFCDVLERIAQIADPEARVWKGSGVLTTDQGIRVLGTPFIGARRLRGNSVA